MGNRQGKMANAPFHVENWKYIYSVEHDDNTYTNGINGKCEYLDIRTKKCKLWNSEYSYCAMFKCAYHNPKYRIERQCSSCGKAILSKLVTKCRMTGQHIDLSTASFCKYYEKIRTKPQKSPPCLSDVELNKKLPLLLLFSSESYEALSKKAKGTVYYSKKWSIAGNFIKVPASYLSELIHSLNGTLTRKIHVADFVIISEEETKRVKYAKQLHSTKNKPVLFTADEFINTARRIILES